MILAHLAYHCWQFALLLRVRYLEMFLRLPYFYYSPPVYSISITITTLGLTESYQVRESLTKD